MDYPGGAYAVDELEQVIDQLRTWAMTTPKVQEALLDRRVPIPVWGAQDEEEKRPFVGEITRILVEQNLAAGWDAPDVAVQVAEQILGIGILEPLLHVKGMEEIIVRCGRVLIEYRGQVIDLGRIADDSYFHTHARRIAEERRRAMRVISSFALADLPDGSRFTALIPPLSVNGTAINVRVFSQERWTVRDLAKRGAFQRLAGAPAESGRGREGPLAFHSRHTAELLALAEEAKGMDNPTAEFLARAIESTRHSILISGRPGAGKSTLMSALTHSLPALTQLCIAETFQEVKPALKHAAWAVVQERRRQDNQGVTLDQVVNTLYSRMRPDLIIVGEIVGQEAVEFLEAMSLGIPAMTTIHGDSARDALHRLERRAQREGTPLQAVREAVASGVHLVVQMDKDGADRFVSEIMIVDGLDDRNHFRLIPVAAAGPRGGEWWS
jgi:pilus assembly protein CpaF